MKRKRSQKWYNENEKRTLKMFGLTPTPGSGNKWKFKEDGYNDKVLCQHKSTDANSYRICRDDLDKLEYHSQVEHKLPLFMIQFLEDDEIYLLLKPRDLFDIANGLLLSSKESSSEDEQEVYKSIDIIENDNIPKRKPIKSSKKSKEKLAKLKEDEVRKRNEEIKKERKRWKMSK